MMGAVTTLLPFMGWLMTDSGTVIRVGSFPYREKKAGLSEGGGKNHHPASPRGRRSRGVLCGAQCSYSWGPDEGSRVLPRGHLSVSLLLPAESEQQSTPAAIRIKCAPEPQGKACVPFNTAVRAPRGEALTHPHTLTLGTGGRAAGRGTRAGTEVIRSCHG